MLHLVPCKLARITTKKYFTLCFAQTVFYLPPKHLNQYNLIRNVIQFLNTVSKGDKHHSRKIIIGQFSTLSFFQIYYQLHAVPS